MFCKNFQSWRKIIKRSKKERNRFISVESRWGARSGLLAINDFGGQSYNIEYKQVVILEKFAGWARRAGGRVGTGEVDTVASRAAPIVAGGRRRRRRLRRPARVPNPAPTCCLLPPASCLLGAHSINSIQCSNTGPIDSSY